MKRAFSFFIFLGLGIALSHCDEGLENPHYPIEPSIAFKSIEFIELPGANTADTLKFTFSYKDGDSDLGLGSEDFNFPYHTSYYFLEDGTGDTAKVYTEWVSYDDVSYAQLKVPFSYTGKLVTNNTRLKANYEYLPVYDLYDCINYSDDQLLVHEAYVDDTFEIRDTIIHMGQRYILVRNAFLHELNSHHNNINVEYFVFDDGVFEEFDWLKEYCYRFYGRFPYIGKRTEKINLYNIFKVKPKTPWEGTITYSMPSTAFISIFSISTMKLRIQIKDRALHTSNTVETPPFTLDEIRKD